MTADNIRAPEISTGTSRTIQMSQSESMGGGFGAKGSARHGLISIGTKRDTLSRRRRCAFFNCGGRKPSRVSMRKPA